MKHFTKTKMITLISAILMVLVATSFLVPYTLAYFAKKHKLGGEATVPEIHCEIKGNGFVSTPINVNNTQMYVASNAFNETSINNTSVNILSNSNIKTFVRVKLTFKLASGNTGITQNELSSLNNNFTANVNASDWILATNDADGNGGIKAINTSGATNAAYLTTYYLYYKGVVNSGEQTIDVYNDFKQLDSTYNGKFLVAELYCEAIQANKKGAQEWMSVALSDVTGWEQTWYNGVKDAI